MAKPSPRATVAPSRSLHNTSHKGLKLAFSQDPGPQRSTNPELQQLSKCASLKQALFHGTWQHLCDAVLGCPNLHAFSNEMA